MPIGLHVGVPGRNAGTVICVDEFADGDMSGRIYNRHDGRPPPFTGVVSLANRMETLFDRISYPGKAFEPRHFHPQSQEPSAGTKPTVKEEGGIAPMSEKEIELQRGKKATFIVQVQFRQNATWQGTVNWTEQKKTQRFRSMLELIRLMDDALEEDAEEPFVQWKDQETKA